MRFAKCIIIAIAANAVCAVAPARADHQPAFVVPGRPDVPVIIDGYDASWAVVEGELGLHRPGHVTPFVIYPFPPAVDHWHVRSYFPVTGKRPRYGRHEIIPPANRRLPPPAESFHRYWSSHSQPVPAQTEYPVFEPPPIVLAPRLKSLN
jgi:hypothetical protein